MRISFCNAERIGYAFALGPPRTFYHINVASANGSLASGARQSRPRAASAPSVFLGRSRFYPELWPASAGSSGSRARGDSSRGLRLPVTSGPCPAAGMSVPRTRAQPFPFLWLQPEGLTSGWPPPFLLLPFQYLCNRFPALSTLSSDYLEWPLLSCLNTHSSRPLCPSRWQCSPWMRVPTVPGTAARWRQRVSARAPDGSPWAGSLALAPAYFYATGRTCLISRCLDFVI